MNGYKSLLVCGGFCVLNCLNLRGQTTDEKTLFVAALKKQLAGLSSMQCRVNVYDHDAAEPSMVLNWEENASSYKFDFAEYDGQGKEVFWSSASSSPDGSMRALEHGKYLNLTKKPRGIPPVVRNVELPLSQYEFLCNTAAKDNWEIPDIKLIADPAVWSAFVPRVKFLGKDTVHGQATFAFQVEGAKGKYLDLPVSYRVYTRADGSFVPVAWKLYDKKEQLLAEYEVLKFNAPSDKTALASFLPQEVKVAFYATQPDEVSKTPTNSQRIQYQNLSLGTIDVDEHLALDVATAEVIRDMDSKTNITVPK